MKILQSFKNIEMLLKQMLKKNQHYKMVEKISTKSYWNFYLEFQLQSKLIFVSTIVQKYTVNNWKKGEILF